MSATPNPIHAVLLSGYSGDVRKPFQLQKAVESTLATTRSSLQQNLVGFWETSAEKAEMMRQGSVIQSAQDYTSCHANNEFSNKRRSISCNPI